MGGEPAAATLLESLFSVGLVCGLTIGVSGSRLVLELKAGLVGPVAWAPSHAVNIPKLVYQNPGPESRLLCTPAPC